MQKKIEYLERRRKEILYFAQEKRIIDKKLLLKLFRKVPRNVVLLERDFSFCNKRVLDIGCNYGTTLLYWRKDSIGIEIEDSCRKFLEHFGYVTISTNVENSFGIDEKFDAVYSNNLIEHLIAPHLFLVRIYSVLRKGGLLALGCPIVPIYPVHKIWSLLGYKGPFAQEHINFFSALGTEWMLKRAGFDVIKMYFAPFERIRLEKLDFINKCLGSFSIHMLIVAKKIEGYRYFSKRKKMFDPGWAKDVLNIFR